MALDNVTLADGQGTPVNHVFTYVSSNGGKVIRANLSAEPEVPELLTYAHNESVKGGVKYRSHLWRVDITILDADGITAHTGNIRVMADIPNPVLSDGLVDNMSAFVRNAFTQAFARAWARGSVG